MLAWFGLDETAAPGAADRLIADLARDLQARGLRIAGAVQTNHDLGPDCACDMDMQVIGDGAAPVRISQSLGAGASGCRLDTGALEEVVARTAPTLPGADLVVIPKFGRQEAMGRGFYSLIAEAAAAGQPVVLYVPRQQRAAFLAFAGGLAVELAPGDVAGWCLEQAAALS
ncbi:DUF2478 domain-containing protein [Paracoccus sediminilitoris]|uniref:DUF2478 domain-containing protein n=1 Tax=Paracoccus sediminilitoris TaxID=2202419 RepID=UPI000DB9AE3B|nr:DUF2478 domain-containing protein [Paracoccus sediminilitoris]